jgi:uncharacterized protein YbjT (DUF2867 family)
MHVVIVGAGRLGMAVGNALAGRGIVARLVSRSTGFDVHDPERSTGIGAADVVIEATDIFTQDGRKARDFFVRSTRAVNAVAHETGARHILVSIVGCEQSTLRGNGYYAAKAEQERVAREEHSNLTIVRSTLWFEFARQNLDRARFGPLAIVPAMTVQPIALGSVAEVVADCITGERSGPLHEVAGPERTTLWRMTTALPDRRALPLPVLVPGQAGRALRDGTLLPGPEVEIAGPRFIDWLTTHHD